jgi:hypothetical protein
VACGAWMIFGGLRLAGSTPFWSPRRFTTGGSDGTIVEICLRIRGGPRPDSPGDPGVWIPPAMFALARLSFVPCGQRKTGTGSRPWIPCQRPDNASRAGCLSSFSVRHASVIRTNGSRAPGVRASTSASTRSLEIPRGQAR